jgi:putative endonuclease
MAAPSPKHAWWRRWFGSRSERAAARFLRQRGHRILCRNWSCDLGEIDLVTRDRDTLVFVEVRSTEQADTQRPLLSVDYEKQHRLTRLAAVFLKRHRVVACPARFDVVAISWPPGRSTPHIDYQPNAFDAVDQQPFS